MNSALEDQYTIILDPEELRAEIDKKEVKQIKLHDVLDIEGENSNKCLLVQMLDIKMADKSQLTIKLKWKGTYR